MNKTGFGRGLLFDVFVVFINVFIVCSHGKRGLYNKPPKIIYLLCKSDQLILVAV